MNNSENESKEVYRLYVLAKDGTYVVPEVIKILVEQVSAKRELEDFGTGSAYNMPVYLLGAIEGHEDTAVVVAWDMDGNQPHPRFLVEPEEKNSTYRGS